MGREQGCNGVGNGGGCFPDQHGLAMFVPVRYEQQQRLPDGWRYSARGIPIAGRKRDLDALRPESRPWPWRRGGDDRGGGGAPARRKGGGGGGAGRGAG